MTSKNLTCGHLKVPHMRASDWSLSWRLTSLFLAVASNATLRASFLRDRDEDTTRFKRTVCTFANLHHDFISGAQLPIRDLGTYLKQAQWSELRLPLIRRFKLWTALAPNEKKNEVKRATEAFKKLDLKEWAKNFNN
jgi:hypothetical protein